MPVSYTHLFTVALIGVAVAIVTLLAAGRHAPVSYTHLQVGGFDNLEEAALMERRLKREGYQTVIVSE